ncbi:HAMP domain-containing histidine kinase [Pseudonocardia kujensis]|uniref:sensor histidine kinase n=1 Tax=Pseudonocardia kujensis TaxID=1128675 RepID=UPI001E5D2191|nr:HAMP domain-containing sensor histidine kinase [Pseudonocardia kujensis]MCE0764519.1 HAMP domain-containing histidine kinase [Pseudonocardia kujensis]
MVAASSPTGSAAPPRPPNLLRRRLPLRWRIAVAFAVVSLAITGLLALATWHLASGFLLAKREQGATMQAAVDARLVQETLHDPVRDGSGDLLTGLAGGGDGAVALRRNGTWTTSGRRFDVDALPDDLLALAGSGTPARQRIIAGGIPVLAVAIPLPDAVYVELAPLNGLDTTLRFLSGVLVAGVGVSGLLGLGLGGWAGRRALRPLTELRDAAARVAAGDLDARLPAQDDADLAPLAATFNRTAEDLQRRVRRDARFAGDVSHELRSPLTTLVNAVAVLRRRRAELPPTARQAVDLLDADVHRFRKMVTDLLEISRDEHVDPADLEVCDVVDIVTHAVGTRTGVAVEVVGTPPTIEVDRRRLDRVVGNLLDNADHHAGGAVRVGVAAADDGVRIEVDDAGPGIPPEFREEVFERFARGATAGRRDEAGGTGLGLALVARHVRAHHGRIRVEDSPAGGARIVVELPGDRR